MTTRSRWPRAVTSIAMLAGLGVGTAGVVAAQRDHAPAPAVVGEAAPAPASRTPPVMPRELPAPPPTRVPTPNRIEVPAVGVDVRLGPRGLRADGSLDTPDFGDAAWYEPGPRPGEAGGAVVVAHVHGPSGPDVFWRLADLEPGHLVRIHRPDVVLTFVVESVEDVAKEALPHDRIWPVTDEPLLRLITCGGTRTEAGYPDNTVVYARLLASAAPARQPSAR